MLKSFDEKGKVVKVRRGLRGGGGQKEDVVSKDARVHLALSHIQNPGA